MTHKANFPIVPSQKSGFLSHINVYNEAEVMWAVATRIQPDRDVVIIPDAYVCELDPSAYDIKGRNVRGYMNSKWFIDATKPHGLPFQE